MTTRYNAVTVVFEKEIREDDLQHWIDAIKLLRSVISVEPVEESSSWDHEAAKLQAKYELREELRKVLWGHDD